MASREGLVKARLRLRWTERLVEMLARAGFDRHYGARPLQRTLETRVVTPLARYLLDRPGLSDAELLLDCDEEGQVRFQADGAFTCH